MTDQRKSWFIPLLTSIITSLSVVAGAWFSLQGTLGSADQQSEAVRLEAAFERIEHLEKQMRDQQLSSNAKIIELTTKVFKLQRQLDKDLNIEDMFMEFMEGLPFEAWVKEVDLAEDGEVLFTMKYLNRAYQFKYGVSQRRYAGSRDRDIWGSHLAEQFRETDLQVYRTKSSIIVTERFPSSVGDRHDTSSYQEKVVLKMYVELIQGKPLIFGMVLDRGVASESAGNT
jgi:hypothetical protein